MPCRARGWEDAPLSARVMCVTSWPLRANDAGILNRKKRKNTTPAERGTHGLDNNGNKIVEARSTNDIANAIVDARNANSIAEVYVRNFTSLSPVQRRVFMDLTTTDYVRFQRRQNPMNRLKSLHRKPIAYFSRAYFCTSWEILLTTDPPCFSFPSTAITACVYR